MTTIGVIGAMQNEIDILIKNYDLKKDKKNKDIYVNEFNDKRIVVAMSGVGKTNSAAMTQYIIDKYNVDAVINSGVAGALNNNLKLDFIYTDEDKMDINGNFFEPHFKPDFSPDTFYAMNYI